MGLGGRFVPLLWLPLVVYNIKQLQRQYFPRQDSNSLRRLLISFIAPDINNKEPKGGGYMVLATDYASYRAAGKV